MEMATEYNHRETMKRTEPCGCKSDGRQWTHMCEEHTREYDTRRAAGAAHNVARSAGTVYTPEYRALAARAATDEPIPEFLR